MAALLLSSKGWAIGSAATLESLASWPWWAGDTGLEIALFSHPERERSAAWHSLWEGRYGPSRWLIAPSLSWSADSCEAAEDADWAGPIRVSAAILEVSPDLALAPLAIDGSLIGAPRLDSAGLDVSPSIWRDSRRPAAFVVPWSATSNLNAERPADCPQWKRRRFVSVARYNGEWESLRLLECDGSVSSDTVDRLSILARPPSCERPALPLPVEPRADAGEHEWIPGLKLVHPRLAWLLQKIGDAFPRRVITLMSGYRPENRAESLHRQGRALDIAVRGVPNEVVFRFCRSLPHVGCGYYPNNLFVHVDVRPPTIPKAFWVDTSGPGERSHYVDSWPGVVDRGALEGVGVD